MLDDLWLNVWVERLRGLYPNTVAVLLAGSHARGEAGPHSDVDLRVVQPHGATAYPVFFEPTANGRLRHISVDLTTLDEWEAEQDEPADWALFLPTEQVERLVWATPDVAARLGPTPTKRQPAGDPQVEDFLEYASKVKNALRVGDSLALRWAAHGQARLAPGLLAPLNPPVRAQTAIHALKLALDFPVAPPGYQQAMLVCLGLDNQGHSDTEIAQASLELARGIFRLLREHGGAGIPEADLRQALLDGTLEQYLKQTAA
ncbi:MAG: nucleotidyltransferase domain-containing protein [Anaerolineae bacterium]|nr:nucleotidyltransferase domain-containing protein [Anaerolineae bacterium]